MRTSNLQMLNNSTKFKHKKHEENYIQQIIKLLKTSDKWEIFKADRGGEETYRNKDKGYNIYHIRKKLARQ